MERGYSIRLDTHDRHSAYDRAVSYIFYELICKLPSNSIAGCLCRKNENDCMAATAVTAVQPTLERLVSRGTSVLGSPLFKKGNTPLVPGADDKHHQACDQFPAATTEDGSMQNMADSGRNEW
jgi:hypothetical protein